MSNIHRKEELEREDDVKGFDYRTTVPDRKTRKVKTIQNYRLELVQGATKGSVTTRIERPIGSGLFFHTDGSPVKDEKIASKKGE